ncbi:hypothetical protein SLEP1_g55966 [Rubroshorea leprosula]|uniref:Uncharacterized protein n=1 Tax=Rubroshorea leprosula TaxID=152421 RepID=A0AAV5MK47_9ROSI|nr:hypothetical protein SLEP1_g55966 [Rubroshorea leprosula]
MHQADVGSVPLRPPKEEFVLRCPKKGVKGLDFVADGS